MNRPLAVRYRFCSNRRVIAAGRLHGLAAPAILVVTFGRKKVICEPVLACWAT